MEEKPDRLQQIRVNNNQPDFCGELYLKNVLVMDVLEECGYLSWAWFKKKKKFTTANSKHYQWTEGKPLLFGDLADPQFSQD